LNPQITAMSEDWVRSPGFLRRVPFNEPYLRSLWILLRTPKPCLKLQTHDLCNLRNLWMILRTIDLCESAKSADRTPAGFDPQITPIKEDSFGFPEVQTNLRESAKSADRTPAGFCPPITPIAEDSFGYSQKVRTNL
jgi:hypothetical protein